MYATQCAKERRHVGARRDARVAVDTQYPIAGPQRNVPDFRQVQILAAGFAQRQQCRGCRRTRSARGETDAVEQRALQRFRRSTGRRQREFEPCAGHLGRWRARRGRSSAGRRGIQRAENLVEAVRHRLQRNRRCGDPGQEDRLAQRVVVAHAQQGRVRTHAGRRHGRRGDATQTCRFGEGEAEVDIGQVGEPQRLLERIDAVQVAPGPIFDLHAHGERCVQPSGQHRRNTVRATSRLSDGGGHDGWIEIDPGAVSLQLQPNVVGCVRVRCRESRRHLRSDVRLT